MPFYQGSAPGQSGAESDEQHQIVLPDLAGAVGLVQRDGDGSGGGVAVAIQVDEEFLDGNAHAFAGAFDDADIRLVRNNKLDLLDADLLVKLASLAVGEK